MAGSVNSFDVSLSLAEFQSASVVDVYFTRFDNPSFGKQFSFTYSQASEYYFDATLDGVSVPYDYSDADFVLSTSSGEDVIHFKFDTSAYYVSTAYPCRGFSCSLAPASDGSPSVDLSSVLDSLSALEADNNSILDAIGSLSAKIDALDVQVPDDLNAKLANLQTNIQNLDLTSLNLGDVLLGSSLNGNMCRYKDGDTVKITGLLGDFKIVWSNFIRFGAEEYTVFYQVSRDVGNSVLKYQFVPESLVYFPTEVV